MKPNRHGGFTLVELLVVIAILVLLMAILLPALNNARSQAHSVQCAANLRTIAAGAISYAADNDGRMPVPSTYNETQKPGDPFAIFCPAEGVLDYRHGTLWGYLPTSLDARQRVSNCPTDVEDYRIASSATHVVPRNFSYSFNAGLRGKLTPPPGTHPGIRLTDIRNPGQKIMVVEENWPNDPSAYLAQNDANDVPASRHLGRSNMAFADGHVDAFAPIDLGFDDTQSSPIVNATLTATYCDLFKP
jgi:prepilin-type N-terminal cleavage/methylation domain-containing protein/prepilin-type processing-associated H-X9-DG protein